MKTEEINNSIKEELLNPNNTDCNLMARDQNTNYIQTLGKLFSMFKNKNAINSIFYF